MNENLEFDGEGYSPPVSHQDIGRVRFNEIFRSPTCSWKRQLEREQSGPERIQA